MLLVYIYIHCPVGNCFDHDFCYIEKKSHHHRVHVKNEGGIEYDDDDTKLKRDVAELGRTLKVRVLCHFSHLTGLLWLIFQVFVVTQESARG